MRLFVLLLTLLAVPAWADDALVLVGPAGRSVTLRPEQGEVLLVHFWATWCPTCLEDLRQLQLAIDECASEALVPYAVNVGEPADVVATFVDRHDLRLPILRDPRGRAWRSVDGRGLPANLFWTSQARRTDVGPRDASTWCGVFSEMGAHREQPVAEAQPESAPPFQPISPE